MPKSCAFDAIIVGSGPNGLAAGIALAQAGLSVKIFEAKNTIGGGTRSEELTLPGFTHDVCSAIHPMALASPFFRSLHLENHGLEWIQPSAPLAHPFDDGTASILERSLDATKLGADTHTYQELMRPLVEKWEALAPEILAPLHIPDHPLMMARLGLLSVQSASGLAKRFFKEEWARGLFAGLAAHCILPLNKPITAAVGLILGMLGHAVGWPMPKGGSKQIAKALASVFQSYGGTIATDAPVDSIQDLPSAKAYLFDVTPRQLLKIAENRLSEKYRNELTRYRYGPGVFKLDLALSSTVPWKAQECLRAGTVHIGGTLDEIAASEQEVWKGAHPEKPFVLVAQQSLFDSTRAPEGKQTLWAYCHVPNGSTFNMAERIESQIERFAPGFRDCILARNTMTAMDLQHYNANYIGGDINGGVQDIFQLFTRPSFRIVPYTTSAEDIYICSSSSPPGGGVHGMCGYHAARAALRQSFLKKI